MPKPTKIKESSTKIVCLNGMPYGMSYFLFNTPLFHTLSMLFYLFINSKSQKSSFRLNTLNTLSFPVKYFYIIIIWNIFAKETSK